MNIQARLSSAGSLSVLAEFEAANGRLPNVRPVAVIDIGSNSVRLVVYEGPVRSPTQLYNEKALCGLGGGVAANGALTEESIAAALLALRRYRLLADQMQVLELHVLATAAVRDAENGCAFIENVETICRVPVRVLSGEEEAYHAAMGVRSGFHRPAGLVGDLGGGSLELTEIDDSHIGEGLTLPLGSLRLREVSGGSVRKAAKIASQTIEEVNLTPLYGERPLYAIGGTWRAFATMHMAMSQYPLRVLHHYTITREDVLELAKEIRRVGVNSLPGIDHVSTQRRVLLPYGAIVLEALCKRIMPKAVVISALGLREGFLFTQLDAETKAQDPLLSASAELALLRARSPEHALELVDWTDRLFATLDVEETDESRRWRIAGCLLADIGWRAHPSYRGEQSLNIIANAAFSGVDHAGRAYLALSVFFRHAGYEEEQPGPRLRSLVDLATFRKAMLLGAALRLAYRLSASMPGILPRTGFARKGDTVQFLVPRDMEDLVSDRVESRLKRVAKINSLAAEIIVYG